MIIDWTTHSLQYERRIRTKTHIAHRCPKCGRERTLKRHGFYKRNLIIWLGYPEEKQLYILRVQCSFCKCTHAILPRDVIPYKVYSFSYYVKILRLLYQFKRQVRICVFTLKTCYNQIYRFLYKIQKEWKDYKRQLPDSLYYGYAVHFQQRKKFRQFLVYTT